MFNRVSISLCLVLLFFSFAADAGAQGQYTTNAVNITTATTTRVVTGSTGQTPYIQNMALALSVVAGSGATIAFVAGTGTNCGTTQTSLSGPIGVTSSTITTTGSLASLIFSPNGNNAPLIEGVVSQDICITTTTTSPVNGWITSFLMVVPIAEEFFELEKPIERRRRY